MSAAVLRPATTNATEQVRDAMSLIKELKRRNVIRMAGLYLVGAWLLIQVASTVLPAFEVPGWALRGLIIVLVLGFAPALIFAWVFELTPQGLKRDEEVRPEESISGAMATTSTAGLAVEIERAGFNLDVTGH
jgi:hypothetical protein